MFKFANNWRYYKEQLNNSKAVINKFENNLKLTITLNKNDEFFDLLIPKYDKNELLNREKVLKLKILCPNFPLKTKETKDHFYGFTKNVIKNSKEVNMLLNSWKDFHNYWIIKVLLLFYVNQI